MIQRSTPKISSWLPFKRSRIVSPSSTGWTMPPDPPQKRKPMPSPTRSVSPPVFLLPYSRLPQIGYPTTPDTMDPLSLERYYSLNEKVEGDDFFGNVVRSNIAQEKRKWIRVGKQLDKGVWDMIPSEVNAYYSRESTERSRSIGTDDWIRSSGKRDRFPSGYSTESLLLKRLVRPPGSPVVDSIELTRL